MAEEDSIVSYKDLSELKKELEGIQSKKDISASDLHGAIVKLADTMSSMIEIFGAAAEQLRLEEKGKESDIKKHEIITSKLDKLLDQNKTIAEGMVAVVEMVKERLGTKDDSSFRPKDNEPMFMKPEPRFARQEWKPRNSPQAVSSGPGQMMPMQPPMAMPSMPNMPPPPGKDFDASLPPMQQAPMPDFDFPEEPNLEDLAEPKKKGILGMFKK